jgi:hypothetical protein
VVASTNNDKSGPDLDSEIDHSTILGLIAKPVPMLKPSITSGRKASSMQKGSLSSNPCDETQAMTEVES